MTKWDTIKQFAREQRKNPTPSERRLWECLRKRQLEGYKFLRQQPIIYKQENNKRYFFIADSYCAEKGLVVELDGKIHEFQKEYDYNRDTVLKGLGLNVLRIENEELIQIEKVKKKILNHLE